MRGVGPGEGMLGIGNDKALESPPIMWPAYSKIIVNNPHLIFSGGSPSVFISLDFPFRFVLFHDLSRGRDRVRENHQTPYRE